MDSRMPSNVVEVDHHYGQWELIEAFFPQQLWIICVDHSSVGSLSFNGSKLFQRADELSILRNIKDIWRQSNSAVCECYYKVLSQSYYSSINSHCFPIWIGILCCFFCNITLISESPQHYYIYLRNLILTETVKHLKTNKWHHKFNLCNSWNQIFLIKCIAKDLYIYIFHL